MHEPGGASFEDSVCIDDELAGAGDDGNAVVFSAFGKALIEGDESLVDSLRGCLSGGEQGLSDPSATACDTGLSYPSPGLLSEGGHSGQGGRFLTGQMAELGHTDRAR